MPAVLAMPLFWGAVGATAAGGAAIYSANKQAGAAEDAAKLQTDSANKAADLQAKAAADTLAFQKQQATLQAQNDARAQLASYEQYTARQNALSSLGQEVGLPARVIPPAPDYLTTEASPNYNPFGPGSASSTTTLGGAMTPPVSSGVTAPASSGTSAATSPTSSAQSFGNLSDPSNWMSLVGNTGKLASWVQSVAPGLSPQLQQYYVSKIQGQPGANATEQAGSAQYWTNKLLSDPTLGGGGTSSQSAANGQTLPYSLASLMMQPPVSPGVRMPGA